MTEAPNIIMSRHSTCPMVRFRSMNPKFSSGSRKNSIKNRIKP